MRKIHLKGRGLKFVVVVSGILSIILWTLFFILLYGTGIGEFAILSTFLFFLTLPVTAVFVVFGSELFLNYASALEK